MDCLAAALRDLAIDNSMSDDFYSIYSQDSDPEQWAIKKDAAALTNNPETFAFKRQVGSSVRAAAAAVAAGGLSGASSSRRAYSAVAAARATLEAAAADAGATASPMGGGTAAAAATEADQHKAVLQANFCQLISQLELYSKRLADPSTSDGQRSDALEGVLDLGETATALLAEAPSEGEAAALSWLLVQCTEMLNAMLA